MQCPKCSAENRPGRRFCSKCGAALALACTACGFQNDPGDEFCGGCGAQLGETVQDPSSTASTESLPGGELRQVTVLFADLAEFTRFSSQRDAEDVHALLTRFFEAVDTVVERYGGTIDKHVGDNVMAVFGAPVAHQDDPERAVRAAFDIHAAMAALGRDVGLQFAVHIGIASGQVLASATGSSRHRTYTVTGDSANLAARLEDLAEAGETLVSDAVHRAVARLVEAEAVDEVAVRGIAKPVRVWRLKGVRPEPDARASAPFVGRHGELAQFTGVLQSCRATGHGQAVYVRGEAGIGKTRLIEELAKLAGAGGFACHKALVLDFGVGIGRDAARALTRSLLGLPGDETETERREAADWAVADRQLEPDSRVYLNDLLDLPQPTQLRALYDAMDNSARNRGKQQVLTTLIRKLSDRKPLLLVIEDIHWADRQTLAHLAAMTTTVRDCPALLVMSSRVEGDPLDPAWRATTSRSPLLTIDLGPLRADEALALTGAFLDASNRLARQCIERAEGNPLFLEQLLRSAEEAEGEEVPASIQSLVLARMDRLSAADRQALQAAAAIGQRFTLATLRHLLDDEDYVCTGLIVHYLVRPEGEDYLFAHALIQEAVYASVLKVRRRILHRRAADWFVERDAVLHAQHLDRAEDPGAPKAYLQAAREQAARYRAERALSLVERGLTIAGQPGDRFALTCIQGELLHDLGQIEPSLEAYRRALDLAPNDIDRCRASIGLAAGMRVSDDFEDAFAALDQAESAAAGSGSTLERARIHHLRGNLFFPLGAIDRCREEHELSLRYAREVGSPESEARALSGLADAEYARGRMRTAHAYFCRCVELCREHGFGRIEVANRSMVGFSRHYLNEVREALADGLAAAEAAARVGHLRAELLGRTMALIACYDMADMTGARTHIEQAQALVRRLGARRFEAQNLTLTAKILRAEGRRAKACQLLQEAIALSQETGAGFFAARAFGELALNADEPETRQRALRDGERVLREGAVSHSHFWFYRDAMEAALGTEDWEDVERYATALEDYTRPEPLPWTDFFIAHGRALAAHGRGRRDDTTMRELARLRDEAERVGLRLALPALEKALLAG